MFHGRVGGLAVILLVSLSSLAGADVRKEGVLTITSPAHERPPGGHRLRTHAHLEGRVTDRNVVWHGPDVPAFIPLHAGAATLDLLDSTATGYMALYRDHDLVSPPMQPLCGMDSKDEKGADIFPGAKKNCAAEVRLFDRTGAELAALPLAPFLSRADHLEVQDAHYEGGTLYFNEACQSYSRNAGGRCSSLVAVDPIARRVLWRTPALTSNNAFAIAGDYIVTAYGFTAEACSIRLVRRRDGVIVDTKSLPSSADDALTVQGDVVSVNLYNMLGRVRFQITGTSGPAPKLVAMADLSGRRSLAARQ
jgi:hypothetical protein